MPLDARAQGRGPLPSPLLRPSIPLLPPRSLRPAARAPVYFLFAPGGPPSPNASAPPSAQQQFHLLRPFSRSAPSVFCFSSRAASPPRPCPAPVGAVAAHTLCAAALHIDLLLPHGAYRAVFPCLDAKCKGMRSPPPLHYRAAPVCASCSTVCTALTLAAHCDHTLSR